MVEIDLGTPVYPEWVAQMLKQEFIDQVIATVFAHTAGYNLELKNANISDEGIRIRVEAKDEKKYVTASKQFVSLLRSQEFWQGVLTATVFFDENPVLAQPLLHPRSTGPKN